MNPEAENLRESLRRCSDAWATHHRKWLYDNADAVAELVDAALDLAACGPCRVSRLYRAADAFKGPQEPPEPERREHTVLYCPEPGCTWWRAADVGPVENAYRSHHHDVHNPGRRE